MTTTRQIMTERSQILKEDATVAEAAKCLAEESIGAVAICDTTGHLRGVFTDGDLELEVIAAGKDPATTKVIDFVFGDTVTIGADDSVEEAIRTMKDYKVSRLPVMDRMLLVGMISEAEIAELGEIGTAKLGQPN